MTIIKSGDLVVLKSGGPTMTVDTVNTDIFDDNKITGVLCVWFVGEKLQRVRFDHGAIEPVQLEPAQLESAQLEKALPKEATSPQASVEYKASSMRCDAMNLRRRRRSQSVACPTKIEGARGLLSKRQSVLRAHTLTASVHRTKAGIGRPTADPIATPQELRWQNRA